MSGKIGWPVLALSFALVGCISILDFGGRVADPGPGAEGGAESGADSSTNDGAGEGSAVDGASSGIDPELRLPGPGMSCILIGTSNDCPTPAFCRIATPTSGRCESCIGPCGHFGDSCTESNECDVQFQCFRGGCAVLCHLGSQDCSGIVADCLNVGHESNGVCRPK